MMVPFWDRLRITHSKILKGVEIKLGHFQKLYQEFTEYMRNHLFKNALVRRGTKYIVDVIRYHLNNLNLVYSGYVINLTWIKLSPALALLFVLFLFLVCLLFPINLQFLSTLFITVSY